MYFLDIKPTHPLDQFIKAFWILEKTYSKADNNEIVYPDGCLNLVFGISGNNMTSNFVGQQNQAVKIPQSGKLKFIAIEFFPFGAFPFFNIPMSEFTDTIISPVDIFGNLFEELNERIFTSSDTTRIQLIEEFLLQKLLVNDIDIEQVKKASHLLYRQKGNLRIGQVAIAVNMTRRTLERKFAAVTGLLPKAMAKIFGSIK